MQAEVVEQIFIRRQGAVLELLLVLESAAGERTRERLPLTVSDPGEALRMAARHLARRGIGASSRLRLRVERGGSLEDDSALRSRFLVAMSDEHGGDEG